MPQASTTPKRKGRAKNNLSSFDINQIEADLFAVESETLGLDSSPAKKTDSTSNQNNTDTASESKKSGDFKAHPVNVVDFNPDNSKLLHKVLRTDQKQIPKPQQQKVKPQRVYGDDTRERSYKPTVKPKVLKVSMNKASVGGMDGFRKPSGLTAIAPSKPQYRPQGTVNPEIIIRPGLNTSAIALTGMSRANQFNRFTLEQHKTSLQNQIEKDSLFTKSLDGDVEIFDKGLQTNSGRKVYNVKRRKSMLGGVDQHNLGPGKFGRALKSKPVKFLTPVFVVFIVAAYITYINIPSISIKMAENKSGVAVSEPSYAPDGYKLSNSIESETGKVAMSFKKSDNESYDVSQQVSDWDSKALLENKILKETTEYSAYTDRGLTIYVYDGKATWVNQGKVYEIKLDGSKIDTEDMVRIAGSM